MSATRCNTLQHVAIRNTLQHVAIFADSTLNSLERAVHWLERAVYTLIGKAVYTLIKKAVYTLIRKALLNVTTKFLIQYN